MLNKVSLKAIEGKVWKSAKLTGLARLLALATNNTLYFNGTLMSLPELLELQD